MTASTPHNLAAPPRGAAGTYARIARRETHSPRSALAILLASVIILAAAWLVTEIVLSLLGQPALLAAPAEMATAVVELPTFGLSLIAGAGIAAAIIGLILIVSAFTAGRRARHVIDGQRSAIVVDNEVIASALARHAARAGAVDPDNARVTVGHRRATVEVTPASGVPVDSASIEAAVAGELDSFGLRPRVTPKVIVHTDGKVGA